MRTSFTESLEYICLGQPLKIGNLLGLSLINKADLTEFQTVWSDISSSRRKMVVEKLVSIAEQRVDVNFDTIFIHCLNDNNEAVQIAAIEGLWENNMTSLILPLTTLLAHGKTIGVRAAAAKALGHYIYLGELEKIDSAFTLVAEQTLLTAIGKSDEDIEVKRRAVESIAFSGKKGIAQIIENAYYHEDERMQVSAVFAMGRNGDDRWQDIVIEEIDNPNPEFRFEATRACGELMLSQSVSTLIDSIEIETDIEVMLNIIWALGQIGGNAAQDTLQKLMYLDDENIHSAVEDAIRETRLWGDMLSDVFSYTIGSIGLLDEHDEHDKDDEEDWEYDGDFYTYTLND